MQRNVVFIENGRICSNKARLPHLLEDAEAKCLTQMLRPPIAYTYAKSLGLPQQYTGIVTENSSRCCIQFDFYQDLPFLSLLFNPPLLARLIHINLKHQMP